MGTKKIIYGHQLGMGFVTGPVHPNGTADVFPAPGCVPEPCVFDIFKDPTEGNNLNVPGAPAEVKALVASLESKFSAYCDGFFQTSLEHGVGDFQHCEKPAVSSLHHGGWWYPPCA